MISFCKSALFVASLAALVACGGKSDDKDEPATVVYGTMTLADSKATTDNGAHQLTTLGACSRDTTTGYVSVVMSLGATSSLSFAIKNYSPTPKAYTCTQAADNKASATDVGSKFETCMVDVKVPAAAGATTLNGYSLYRETITVKPFTYAGTCAIDVTAAVPAIQGTLACTDLVQTTLEGGVRNPIDPAVTADVTANFNCTFQ